MVLNGIVAREWATVHKSGDPRLGILISINIDNITEIAQSVSLQDHRLPFWLKMAIYPKFWETLI